MIVNPVNAGIILQVVQYLTDPGSGSHVNRMLVFIVLILGITEPFVLLLSINCMRILYNMHSNNKFACFLSIFINKIAVIRTRMS